MANHHHCSGLTRSFSRRVSGHQETQPHSQLDDRDSHIQQVSACNVARVKQARIDGADTLGHSVASYPLLLLYALYHVSPHGGLAHLHWRVKDTSDQVVERATVYILVNLLVVELAR